MCWGQGVLVAYQLTYSGLWVLYIPTGGTKHRLSWDQLIVVNASSICGTHTQPIDEILRRDCDVMIRMLYMYIMIHTTNIKKALCIHIIMHTRSSLHRFSIHVGIYIYIYIYISLDTTYIYSYIPFETHHLGWSVDRLGERWVVIRRSVVSQRRTVFLRCVSKDIF